MPDNTQLLRKKPKTSHKIGIFCPKMPNSYKNKQILNKKPNSCQNVPSSSKNYWIPSKSDKISQFKKYPNWTDFYQLLILEISKWTRSWPSSVFFWNSDNSVIWFFYKFKNLTTKNFFRPRNFSGDSLGFRYEHKDVTFKNSLGSKNSHRNVWVISQYYNNYAPLSSQLRAIKWSHLCRGHWTILNKV